jgi:hypothetical protein
MKRITGSGEADEVVGVQMARERQDSELDGGMVPAAGG